MAPNKPFSQTPSLHEWLRILLDSDHQQIDGIFDQVPDLETKDNLWQEYITVEENYKRIITCPGSLFMKKKQCRSKDRYILTLNECDNELKRVYIEYSQLSSMFMRSVPFLKMCQMLLDYNETTPYEYLDDLIEDNHQLVYAEISCEFMKNIEFPTTCNEIDILKCSNLLSYNFHLNRYFRSGAQFVADDTNLTERSGGLKEQKWRAFVTNGSVMPDITLVEYVDELTTVYKFYGLLRREYLRYRPVAQLVDTKYRELFSSVKHSECGDLRWINFCNAKTLDRRLHLYKTETRIEFKEKMESYMNDYYIPYERHALELCAICLDSMREMGARTLTCCRQRIHHLCLWQWVLNRKTCPFCRRNVSQ